MWQRKKSYRSVIAQVKREQKQEKAQRENFYQDYLLQVKSVKQQRKLLEELKEKARLGVETNFENAKQLHFDDILAAKVK